MICRNEFFTIHVCRAGSREWCLTASLNGPVEDPGGVASAVYREAASILSQMNAEIVRERIFATIELHSCLLAARNRVLRDAENGCLHPITFIQGRPLWGGGFAGVQIYAVQPAHPEEKVWTLYGENGPCGRAWSRSGATFLMLQDLHGFPDKTVIQPSKMEQAGNMFERADRLLHQFGASYRDVVRTWIYLSGILDWYDDFNAVRNARYTAWGLMPENGSLVSSNRLLLPASTGIRGDHPSGAACAMDILAVTGPADARPTVIQMDNRLQLAPHRYGKAFSRGACIRCGDAASVHISGTAAVGEHGQGLGANDARAQIFRTFDHIEALLAPVGASLRQIAGASVFLKRAADWPVYQHVLAERGLQDLPAVVVVTDLCREELLFQVDGIACALKA